MHKPMRLFNSVLHARATSSLLLAASGFVVMAALPGKILSQGVTLPPAQAVAQSAADGWTPPPPARAVAQSAAPDTLIEACYVASTGVVYLIKAPGLRAFC
ncbi:MAG TPA: hypothetical protein VK571_03205, partial [Gemmatimonadaceae bacterium]|nr:hypothetical protein [Gemmatimonadaceae bacterium]